MKLLIALFALAATVASAPQDLLFGTDPSVDTPPPNNADQPGDNFFTRFFGGNFPPLNNFPPTFTHETFPVLPSLPEFPEFPNITSLGDLPNGYKNSTHEVKVVDGSRMEINRTVTKTENNGVIITQIIFRVSPDGDGPTAGNDPEIPESASGDASPTPKDGGTSSGEGQTVPEADPTDNQVLTKPYEDFEIQEEPLTNLTRHRRWLMNWFTKSFSRPNVRTKSLNSLPVSSNKRTPKNDDLETHPKVQPESTTLPVPAAVTEGSGSTISYVGDTDVNYRGPKPRFNPDAEVFDVDLVRENEDRFFARRPRPIMSQPIRSQPIRSKPLRSERLRSKPMRFESLKSQPMRFESLKSQPMRFESLKSQPMRVKYLKSQPIRFQSLRSQLL